MTLNLKELNMTKEEFLNMDFEEQMQYCFENCDEITTFDTLIEYVQHKLDEHDLHMALYILDAVYNSNSLTDYFNYDYSLGTLDTPEPINSTEDLLDFLEFEE